MTICIWVSLLWDTVFIASICLLVSETDLRTNLTRCILDQQQLTTNCCKTTYHDVSKFLAISRICFEKFCNTAHKITKIFMVFVLIFTKF